MSDLVALIPACAFPAIVLFALAAFAWTSTYAPFQLIGETDEEFRRRRGGGR